MTHNPQDRPDAMRQPDRPIIVDETDARGGINANVRYVLIVSTLGAILVLTAMFFGFITPA
ncbi:MAG: hypothetical protein ACRCXM_01730 [Beijerinckiaceae bacterium]